MTDSLGFEVECYSGHTYAQEPRAVTWQGRRAAVAQIEGRWRAPEGPVFRVRLESGERLELRYSEIEENWEISDRSDRFPETCQVRSQTDKDKEVLA